MVLGGLFLTSLSSELSPTLPLQPSSFPKELQYAHIPPFSPFVPISVFLWTEAPQAAAAEVHTPCCIWETAAFPWLVCTTTAIGQGIKFSLLQQKLSVLHLSHLKKNFLNMKLPPGVWQNSSLPFTPSCLCQVPKSITLTTQCITVIA